MLARLGKFSGPALIAAAGLMLSANLALADEYIGENKFGKFKIFRVEDYTLVGQKGLAFYLEVDPSSRRPVPEDYRQPNAPGYTDYSTESFVLFTQCEKSPQVLTVLEHEFFGGVNTLVGRVPVIEGEVFPYADYPISPKIAAKACESAAASARYKAEHGDEDDDF